MENTSKYSIDKSKITTNDLVNTTLQNGNILLSDTVTLLQCDTEKEFYEKLNKIMTNKIDNAKIDRDFDIDKINNARHKVNLISFL